MPLFAELNREQLRALAQMRWRCCRSAPPNNMAAPRHRHGFPDDRIDRHRSRPPATVPVVVAPTLPFGSSHHHFVFGATLSLSTETYYRVLYELCESLVTDGFKRIFLLNGHGGNHELAELAVRDIVLKHPVRAAAGSYWRIAGEDLRGAVDRFPWPRRENSRHR
jgi:hypothetical protein